MGILSWLFSEPPRPTLRPNHDDNPLKRFMADPAADIEGIPLDYFWKKVEEVLPDDWGFMLAGALDERGKMFYLAEAALGGEMEEGQERPSISSEQREMPERAIEDLFYRLRDML